MNTITYTLLCYRCKEIYSIEEKVGLSLPTVAYIRASNGAITIDLAQYCPGCHIARLVKLFDNSVTIEIKTVTTDILLQRFSPMVYPKAS